MAFIEDDNHVIEAEVYEPRRKRNLTNEDIDAIVAALIRSHTESCRFSTIDPEDLSEAIKFYKNFNKMVSEGKSTIMKAVLILIIGGFAGIVWLGFVTKVHK